MKKRIKKKYVNALKKYNVCTYKRLKTLLRWASRLGYSNPEDLQSNMFHFITTDHKRFCLYPVQTYNYNRITTETTIILYEAYNPIGKRCRKSITGLLACHDSLYNATIIYDLRRKMKTYIYNSSFRPPFITPFYKNQAPSSATEAWIEDNKIHSAPRGIPTLIDLSVHSPYHGLFEFPLKENDFQLPSVMATEPCEPFEIRRKENI